VTLGCSLSCEVVAVFVGIETHVVAPVMSSLVRTCV